MNKSSSYIQTTLIVAALSLLGGCGGTSPAVPAGEEKAPVVTGVATAVVTAEKVGDTFEAPGVVRARISTIISAKVVGTIVAMRVSAGDRVRAGQVMIEIENRDARAQLDKAQAGLREAESSTEELERNLRAAEAAQNAAAAQRRLAEATLKRYQALRERKSVSEQEYDEVAARAQVALAEVERADRMQQVLKARRQMVAARIDQARADVGVAEVYVSYARITAPVDGLVVAKHADVGTLAAPGAPLLTIEGTARGGGLRLEATVEESRLASLAVGTAATVRIDALGGLELAGRVGELVPAADPASRSFTVRIDLPANPALRSGIFGRAEFSTGQREALLIPARSLVTRGQLTSVYVIDAQGLTRLRLVTIGRQRLERVEVLSGLEAGEKIVAESARIEREGVQVK